ncbi:transposase [Streptomyces sp. NPDC006367]|uniref:transposase n=1 Tax=Streptomyces sp. NPDC006367 TaxID=3156759 RepID=UPI0033A9C005
MCSRSVGEPRAAAAPRKYPDEFRERAVREVRTTGRPIAHVAKNLGIHKEALCGWVRRAEADAGERDDRLTTAEPGESKQLRVERAIFQRVTRYDEERLRSALDHVPPAEYERGRWRQQEAAPQSA